MKIKRKKLILIGIIVALLTILQFTGAMPYIVARVSSSVYVAVNYPAERLKFENAEYLDGFGNYGVVYMNNDGSDKVLGLQMYPKEFPIIVLYDSLNGHA